MAGGVVTGHRYPRVRPSGLAVPPAVDSPVEDCGRPSSDTNLHEDLDDYADCQRTRGLQYDRWEVRPVKFGVVATLARATRPNCNQGPGEPPPLGRSEQAR